MKKGSSSRLIDAMKSINNNRTPITSLSNAKHTHTKYKYGGKKVPGMYAQNGMEMSSSQERPMINSNQQSRVRMNPEEIRMMQMQAQEMQKEKQMQEMIMQIKMQNDSLMKQNELLKTQIQKTDLINSARTTRVNPGANTSPKKRGGSNKKISKFIGGNNGHVMKNGGSLKNGRYSKKR